MNPRLKLTTTLHLNNGDCRVVRTTSAEVEFPSLALLEEALPTLLGDFREHARCLEAGELEPDIRTSADRLRERA